MRKIFLIIMPLLILFGGGALWAWPSDARVGSEVLGDGFEQATAQQEKENLLLKAENDRMAIQNRNNMLLLVASSLCFLLVSALAAVFYRFNQKALKMNARLREQQMKIIDQNHELKEATRVKDKLLSIVSHDFRSPLNQVKAFINLLNRGNLTEKEARLLTSKLLKSVSHAEQILNDLLVLAKRQTNTLEARPQSIPLKQFSQEMAAQLAPYAEEAKINFRVKVAENCNVYADPAQLQVVFRNLIGNAIKHSEKTKHIDIEAEESGDAVAVRIKDYGVGMEDATAAKLFDVKSIASEMPAHDFAHGLGLIITREFVEKNGGTIWVESQPGKGTTIHFYLPVAVGKTEPVAQAA